MSNTELTISIVLKAFSILSTVLSLYCFSLDYLVDKGLFDLKKESLATNGGSYSGIVEAVKNGNAYTYTVYIKNDEFMVNGIANTVDKEKDVKVSGTLTSVHETVS